MSKQSTLVAPPIECPNHGQISKSCMNKAQILACILLTCVTPSFAGSITVVNASFEDPTGLVPCNTVPPLYPAACRFSSGPPTGWTASNSFAGYAGTFQPSTAPTAAFTRLDDLASNAFINGSGTGNGGANTPGAFLIQTVTNTVAGNLYTLTVDMGWRSDNAAFNSEADLVINGTTIVKALGTTPVQGSWSTFTATFAASTDGQSIAIKLLNTGLSQANFDNVTLNAIPEPGTIAMTAIGLGVLALGFRRKRS